MRRKAIIDARATNSAQIGGVPWWAKLLVVIIAIFILSAVVSTYTDSAGGGGRQQDQQQQEEFERNVEKQKQEQCKLARNQGIKLPWC
jgi:hypothetical protein